MQGKYLGELLSERNGEVVKQSVKELESAPISPFKYKHLGSFAYVGDNKAVLQLPVIGQPSHMIGHVILHSLYMYRFCEWLVDHVAVEGSLRQ